MKHIFRKTHRFFLLLASCLLALSSYSQAAVVKQHTLDEIRVLANSGAAMLAVRILDSLQPEIVTDKENWMALERERISIYQQSENWTAMAERLSGLPTNLPDDFIRWGMTQRALAFINAGQANKARQVLQELIWNSSSQSSDAAKWVADWRRMIIDSFLMDGNSTDAHIASTSYYRDHPQNRQADLVLRARILLMSGRAEQAMELLNAKASEPDAGMLYLLAQLRSDARPARKVMQAGLRQMRGEWVKARLKSHLWAVVAEAAQRSGDRVTTANALEHVIAGQKRTPLPEGLFDFTVDSLWNAYIDFASYVGNKNQFLIGQDKQWFKAAKKASKKQPVRARSIYALLMLKGASEKNRIRAAKHFIALMRKRRSGANLMQALFLESNNFKDYAAIPEPVRHELADIALARSDIQLASELMANIQAPPAGADQFFWTLRRARIFVLGGDTLQGVATLERLLQAQKTLDTRQLEKTLQVVFDLQTVAAHEAAFALFEQIQQKTTDQKIQREIFYWMAESRKAADNYAEAARLYLKSAMLIGEAANDPWAQTARYQAAESLAKAGMLADARQLYSQLLKVTKEPARRAVLQHELQKLWLLEKQQPL